VAVRPGSGPRAGTAQGSCAASSDSPGLPIPRAPPLGWDGGATLPYLIGIQCLRAVAAFAVLLYHAIGRLPGRSFEVGAAGVDAFFVISGFIMVSTVVHRAPLATAFLYQRAVRIVPLYWAVTIGIVLLTSAVPAAMPNFTWDCERLAASLLFVPHLDPAGKIWPLVVSGWTLNYEMFFYALIGLALLLPERLQLRCIFGALGLLVLAGVVLQPTQPLARSWTDPLLVEFAAGGALALLHARGRLPGPGSGITLLGGSLGCFALLAWMDVVPVASRVLAYGLPAVAMVAGTLALEPRLRHQRGLAPLLLLGDASYSVYLTHSLVVSATIRLVGAERVPLYLLASLALACVLGVGCFLLFERPVTRFLRHLPARLARQAVRA
jgi:exopolysaccharide production protein ExoZ